MKYLNNYSHLIFVWYCLNSYVISKKDTNDATVTITNVLEQLLTNYSKNIRPTFSLGNL